MGILQTMSETSWAASHDKSAQKNAIQSLEEGKIVFFPQLDFELRHDELSLLSSGYSDGKAKNISLDIHKGTLSGALASLDEKRRLMQMMRRFSECTVLLLNNLFPSYSGSLQVGRTSYRPVEILGRKGFSSKKDDTRLHVDAFPASPNQGRRILRVFSNINPHGHHRLWRVGESFEKVAHQFLPRVTKPFLNGRWLKKLGLTRGIRTDYDHIMLQIHDRMKADLAYQKQADQQELVLPAGSTWIVKTDVVSHAVLSGQYVLEQTFYLPVSAMGNEAVSPLRILERLVGRQLV